MITRFDVNAVNYDPDAQLAPKRPDRAEVRAAQVEADDPATPWVSHVDAKRDSAAWRRRVLAAPGRGNY